MLGRLVHRIVFKGNGWTAWTRPHSGAAMPSTLSTLEVAEEAPLVSGYGPDGFSLQGNYVLGSVALLPRGFFNWRVRRVEDISKESLALFHMVVPRIELLIIGTGNKIVRLDNSIYEFLRSKGINVEVQDTPSACATFNYLLDDMRLAAAALIPPETID